MTTQEAIKFIDMWSCGIVMYALLSGRVPFLGELSSRTECARLLRRMDVVLEKGTLFPEKWGWNHISENATDLVMRLLTRTPDRRITAVDALQHPFLLGMVCHSPVELPTPHIMSTMTREAFAMNVNTVQSVHKELSDDLDADDLDPVVAAPQCPLQKEKVADALPS